MYCKTQLNKWVKSNLFLFALGLIFAAFSIMAGGQGWFFQQITVSILFFLVGAYFANKECTFNKILILVSPFFLIYGFAIFFFHTYHVLPILLSCPISTMIGKYYFSSNAQSIRIKGVLIILGFILFNQSIVLPNWLVFTLNKPNFISTQLPRFAMLNEKRDTVWSDSWKGNIVILDFWSTSCAPCIKKFPELEKVKNVYSRHKNIKIFSVNLPLKRDSPHLLNRILNGYTFETLYAIDRNSLKNKIEIEKIPYVVIIDSDGIIRYRGGLHTNWNIFVSNLYFQINGLLQY